MHFGVDVSDLEFDTYEEYLESDHWVDFRYQYETSGLPCRCLACDYPRFALHHITYSTLGGEGFSDVIPLCKRCHSEIHETIAHHKDRLDRPDISLRRIFAWTAEEVEEKFRPFRKYIKLDGGPEVLSPKKPARKIKDHLKKLKSNDREVCRFAEEGYSARDISKLYFVSETSVREYFTKNYPWFTFSEPQDDLQDVRDTILEMIEEGAAPGTIARKIGLNKADLKSYIGRNIESFPGVNERWFLR